MLTAKAKTAVVWSGLEIFLRQGIGFVISVALARLLSPKEFGTIALLSLFMGIAWVMVNTGFSTSLVQKQDTSLEEESTIFWFNIVIGVLMAAILAGLAPWIARFYHVPVLLPLTIAMAFNIIFSAASSVHNTLLTKRLDFKTPMKIGVISTTLSGGVALYMAWAGYGVWALAGQSLLSNFVCMLMLWILNPWRPILVFSTSAIRRLSGFGGYLLASRLLNMTYRRGYTLLIGKFFGLSELGFYNRAERLQWLPTSIIAGAAAKVSLPLFSSVNHDKVKLRKGARLANRSMMVITVPIIFGLSILSEPFVQVLLGDQWLPAAPILKILCFTGLLWPLDIVNINLLKAMGYANLYFRLEIAKVIIGMVLLVFGSLYGVMGIAYSCVIHSVIGFIINARYTGIYLDYGLQEQIHDCLPTLLMGGLMTVTVYLVDSLVKTQGVLNLVLLILLGAIVYLAGNLVFGIRAFKEAVDLIKMQRLQ